MYTLDTNAIIYYLKNDPKTVSVLEEIFNQDFPIYISAITEAELFGFSNLTFKEAKRIDDLLTTLLFIPLDSHLARIAGFFRRQYKLKIPDCIIAATATFTNSTLITRNIRDFKKIPDVKLLQI